ncbi:hypothetical protein FQN49_000738 [Arthroderma sp. PD_2]|nr:hypothetical protein FQN49_000738 [Arthroderma sp. PD_2]
MGAMLLSPKLAVLGTCRLQLQGLLSSPGVNSVRYLSVNSAITSGIRKGQGFGESKRSSRDWSIDRDGNQRAAWDRRGRTSPRFRKPGEESNDYMGDRYVSDRYALDQRGDRGDRPFERKGPPSWKRDRDGFGTYRSGVMASDRTDGFSRGRHPEKSSNKYQRPKVDAMGYKDPKKHLHGKTVNSRTNQRLNGNVPSGENRQLGGYAKTEDEVQDMRRPLSGKVYLVPPLHIPYTSPLSEFIYGTSAVNAAVRCGRRKLHTLYIYEETPNSRTAEPKWEQPQIRSIAKYASLAGTQIKCVTGPWKNTLDKMTGKRPHNGLVLEASPLPKPPVLNFQAVLSSSNTHFLAQLAPQPDEQAAVNGTDGHIPFEVRRKGPKSSRFPFTLLLDGILDPGNLGAIFRSAHWFGVDAIAFSPLNSAPISPVVMKASAGATETIPMLSIRDVNAFVTGSQANGWKFFAADAPNATQANEHTRKIPALGSLDSLSSELQKAPCVLMLGGEGSGLQQKIKNRADAFVTIPGAYSDNVHDDIAGVSSLNVSVASALLCEAFLSRPTSGGTDAQSSSEDTTEDTNFIF